MLGVDEILLLSPSRLGYLVLAAVKDVSESTLLILFHLTMASNLTSEQYK